MPEHFDVVERRGCDVAPVDASTDEGATHLRSFIWPWHLDRHARFDAALEVVRDTPVTVDRATAGSWLRDRLSGPVDPDVLTVVWHSVTRMYWPAKETSLVDQVVAEARARMPVAHVAMEHSWHPDGSMPAGATGLPFVELDGEAIARCGHHGPSVTLLA